MHLSETFLWGFLGSAAVEIMSLFGFYTTRRGRLPGRYRKVGLWVTCFVLALVAGARSRSPMRSIRGSWRSTSAPQRR